MAAGPSAMLMAAGLGTRLRPFSDLLPKPLLPVMGIPVAQFALDSLAAAGASRVVVNVHHLADEARAGLQVLDAHGMQICVSDESRELLGSGGGIREALPLLGEREPFFLLNSDVLCDVDLGALWRQHQRLRAQWGVEMTLAIFPRSPAGGAYREILVDQSSGLISGLGQKTNGRPFFIGAAVLEPGPVGRLSQGVAHEFVPMLLEPAIRARRAGVFMCDGIWHDMGEPALWLEAHLALIRGLETGTIPGQWRRRIESVCHRVGTEAWVAGRGSQFRAGEVCGPAFVSSGAQLAPVGPRAVLYGEWPSGVARLENGISYGGQAVVLATAESRLSSHQ